VSLDSAPRIFNGTLLSTKSKECLTAVFVRVCLSKRKIGKDLDFISANVTASEAMQPIFSKKYC